MKLTFCPNICLLYDSSSGLEYVLPEIYRASFKHKGSYMSALVLLNLLNELVKRDKNARFVEYIISFSQRV